MSPNQELLAHSLQQESRPDRGASFILAVFSDQASVGIAKRRTIVLRVLDDTRAWADRTPPGIQRIRPAASQTTGLPHRSFRGIFRSIRISLTFFPASIP